MFSPKTHGQALALATFGIVLLSPDALLIKFILIDMWAVVFYRSLFLLMLVAALLVLASNVSVRDRFQGLGIGGVAAGALFAASTMCFIFSIRHTTAANTLVVIGAMPMAAAVLRRVFLKESTAPRTWGAAIFVFAAVAYLGGSGLKGDDVLGVVAAIGVTVFMSAHFTILSARPKVDRFAVLAVGALLSMIPTAMMATSLAASPQDLALLAILGGVVVGGSFLAFGIATRILPSPEVTLVMLLEMLLGPLLVWWVLGEEPAHATMMTGLIIAATVMVHSLLGLRARAAQKKTPGS